MKYDTNLEQGVKKIIELTVETRRVSICSTGDSEIVVWHLGLALELELVAYEVCSLNEPVIHSKSTTKLHHTPQCIPAQSSSSSSCSQWRRN